MNRLEDVVCYLVDSAREARPTWGYTPTGGLTVRKKDLNGCVVRRWLGSLIGGYLGLYIAVSP